GQDLEVRDRKEIREVALRQLERFAGAEEAMRNARLFRPVRDLGIACRDERDFVAGVAPGLHAADQQGPAADEDSIGTAHAGCPPVSRPHAAQKLSWGARARESWRMSVA